MYVNLGDFDVSGNGITMCAWVNLTTADNDPRIISKEAGTAAGDTYWMLGLADAGPYARVRIYAGGGASTVDDTVVLSTDTWYWLAGRYDPTSEDIDLFRDSGTPVQNAGKTGSIRTGSQDVWICDNPGGGAGSRPFRGIVDDARIYSRPLVNGEMSSIYRSRGRDGIVDGLVSRYLFRGGAPGVVASGAGAVKDIGPGAHHGTPGNSPTYAESELSFRRGPLILA